MKYYAFLTPTSLGIFTNWPHVESIVSGAKNTVHKSFHSYDEAKQYILSQLSDTDRVDYCLDRCTLYLNKKFVRKAQYILEKTAQSK